MPYNGAVLCYLTELAPTRSRDVAYTRRAGASQRRPVLLMRG
jgi:hypothetical protein